MDSFQAEYVQKIHDLKSPPQKIRVSWIFFPNQFRQQEPCLERIRAAMPDHLDRSYMGRQWRQPLFPHGAGCRGLWRPKLSLHRFWRPLRRLGDGDRPRSSWRLGHLGLQQKSGGCQKRQMRSFFAETWLSTMFCGSIILAHEGQKGQGQVDSHLFLAVYFQWTSKGQHLLRWYGNGHPQHPPTEQYLPVRWAERIHFHHVLTGLGDLWLYRGVYPASWNLGPGCCAQWLQASLDGDPCWAQVQPLDSWYLLEGKVQWNDQHDYKIYKGGPQRQVLLVHR